MYFQPVPDHFSSEEEKIELVRMTEKYFSLQLDALCDRVTANTKLSFLSLCGPSCSGKTTTSTRLSEALCRNGRTVRCISLDDFFRDREDLNRESDRFSKKVDYDSASALDFSYLEKCLENLSSGKETFLPHYDFHTGRRDRLERYLPVGNELFLFEGIQALYPEFTRLIDSSNCLSVFVNVESGYQVGKELFSARDIRLCRRIVRDYYFRNSPPAFTLFLWESVASNEEQNIFPYVQKADIRINSAYPYELSVIREDLLKILNTIPPQNDWYSFGKELSARFSFIEPIDKKYIPADSLYREFLRF